jgi:DNA-directed RNA polymerase subunit E'/Rpb7
VFELLLVRDTVKVLASVLHSDLYNNHTSELLLKILRREIRLNYVSRVLPGRGLVVACFAITSVGEAQLFPGDAAWYFRCEFQLIMFNPKANDAILALPISSFSTELHLTNGFFQDVYLLPDRLPVPRRFAPDGLWRWEVGEPDAFVFLLGEPGRYRVVEVLYNVKTPARPVAFKNRGRGPKAGAIAPPKESEELTHIRQVIQKRDADDIQLASQFGLLGLDDDDWDNLDDDDDDDDNNGGGGGDDDDDDADADDKLDRRGANKYVMGGGGGSGGGVRKSGSARSKDEEAESRAQALASGRAQSYIVEEDASRPCEIHSAPMVIIVQATDSGLGPIRWWGSKVEAAEEGEGDGAQEDGGGDGDDDGDGEAGAAAVKEERVEE